MKPYALPDAKTKPDIPFSGSDPGKTAFSCICAVLHAVSLHSHSPFFHTVCVLCCESVIQLSYTHSIHNAHYQRELCSVSLEPFLELWTLVQVGRAEPDLPFVYIANGTTLHFTQVACLPCKNGAFSLHSRSMLMSSVCFVTPVSAGEEPF